MCQTLNSILDTYRKCKGSDTQYRSGPSTGCYYIFMDVAGVREGIFVAASGCGFSCSRHGHFEMQRRSLLIYLSLYFPARVVWFYVWGRACDRFTGIISDGGKKTNVPDAAEGKAAGNERGHFGVPLGPEVTGFLSCASQSGRVQLPRGPAGGFLPRAQLHDGAGQNSSMASISPGLLFCLLVLFRYPVCRSKYKLTFIYLHPLYVTSMRLCYSGPQPGF